MKVIVVANQKGGVGKTTIADNLAVCAAKEGKKVLIIDSDTQASSMLFRKAREAADIQTVSILTDTINKDIIAFENFDLVIVDAGGRDDGVFRSAILASSNGILLVPVTPSAYDIWSTSQALKVVQVARNYVPIDAYTFFNRAQSRTKIAKDARESMEEMIETNDIKPLNTIITARVAFAESISEGLGVIEYEPKGKATEEMLSLYNEIKDILQI